MLRKKNCIRKDNESKPVKEKKTARRENSLLSSKDIKVPIGNLTTII